MFGLENLKKIEYLENEVEKLTKELANRSTTSEVDELRKKFDNDVSELEKENKKLARIIKYAKDIPTCRIESYTTLEGNTGFWPAITTKCILYVYINKEEYTVDLPKLRYDHYDIRRFDVVDNLATLEIGYDWTDTIFIDKYIIDYKKGTYVHSSYEVPNKKESENEVKECTDC